MHYSNHPIVGWMQFGLLPFLLWGGAAQFATAQLGPGSGAVGASSSTAAIIDLAAYRARRFGRERRRRRLHAQAAWQEW
jgi:hypothetical protein